MPSAPRATFLLSRTGLALAAGAATLALAACSSSGGTTDTAAPSSASAFANGSSSASSASSSAAATDSAGSSDSSGASASPAASPSSGTPGSPGIPAVGNATDLKQQPTIQAGKGTAPTQLVIADLVPGSGKTAAPSDTVTVQYVGANYADGKVFDSSWTRGQPATFALDQVVPGFAQGIAGMKVGGRREIVIPPALGYGDQAQGPIQANETLVFVVDLVSIGS